MILKKEVVLNSVAEFLGIWAVRGEASLSLKTKDGVTTIAFSHSLFGHPEDPLHPPPAPTGTSRQRRRRRGPARRERDRQRAARHQAAQAGAPPVSPPPGGTFQCDQCDKLFKTESGLKIHKGKSHKLQSPTPVTTSAPVVASSSSITTPASISSPVTTATPLTEPVFGPSIPFIFSTTQIFRQTELPLKCDKCQFSCDPLIVMQNHRKEKHRLWECRRCGDSYTNLLTNMIVVPENVVSIHM